MAVTILRRTVLFMDTYYTTTLPETWSSRYKHRVKRSIDRFDYHTKKIQYPMIHAPPCVPSHHQRRILAQSPHYTPQLPPGTPFLFAAT